MDDPRPLPRIAQRNIDDVYEQEPIRIRAFVKRGLELSDNGSPSDFISYALCGRDEQKQQQATIDIHRNPDADPAALTTTRDYDSAIGVMAELDMDLPINVFPVSPPRKRLQNNVHLFIPIQRNEIQIRVPLHQIPNMLLAEFGTRGQIRLFFPGLHREDRQNSAMSDDELASIYEKGVRPAAANAHVDHVAEWPATYHSEVTRIRGYKYGTKLVSHWHVNMFAGELRKSLESEDNGVPWAHGFLFEVEIMGVKALHPHQANDQPQAELALEALMNGITTGAGRWYIDVGLEFAQAGSIIAWRTDSHFHILRHVLSENEQHARRLTRMGSSKYSRDPFMLLTDLSGCRITPGSRGGPHEVAYLQLYVTDKSQTFSRDPSKKCYALYVNGSAIIAEGNKGRVPSLLVQLDELYRDAARIADGSGRIEIRVPLQHASSALLGLPDDLLKQSLKNIKRDTWWGLRRIRLQAIIQVLRLQASGTPVDRNRPQALTLTASCVYILNSLHARPYEGSAVYDLLFAALPHTIVRTDVTRIEDPNPNAHGQISSPHAPFGIVTLRQIKFDPIPRFLSGRNYSDRACRFFFGKHPSALEEEIRPMGVRQEDGPTRVPSSKGMTKEILSFGTRPQEFHLESIGIKIDSNACIESDEEDDEVMDGVVGLDGRLNKIWHQFLSDVVQKCPNPKGRGYSYCRLTHEGKLKASKHTYGPDLSKTFRAVWVKKVSNKEWNSNIDTLFPPKGTVRVHGPSYQNCRYFSSWMKLMGSVSKQAAVSISAEIRAIVINDLRWLPAVEDKRMWRSGKGIMNGFSHYPASHDSSEVTQAPYVLLSPKLQQIVWQDRPQDVMFGPTGEVYVDGEEDDIDVMDNQEDRQLWPGPAVAPLAQEEEESSGGEN